MILFVCNCVASVCIRTPINAVLGFDEMIIRESEEEAFKRLKSRSATYKEQFIAPNARVLVELTD